MTGSATFLDQKNKLLGEVNFGKVPGQEHDALLQRTDAVSMSIHEVNFPQREPDSQDLNNDVGLLTSESNLRSSSRHLPRLLASSHILFHVLYPSQILTKLCINLKYQCLHTTHGHYAVCNMLPRKELGENP